MKIRIFSYGGSGLKYLTNKLKVQLKDVIDKKHQPHKFQDVNNLQIDKAIVIYGDPRNAVFSFFRRQCRSQGWAQRHLCNIHPDKRETDAPFADQDTIKEYLQNNDKDAFQLEKHFDYWLNCNNNIPIGFIRYEALTDQWTVEQLREFLEIQDNNFNSDIRENFRKRGSNYEDLSSSQREKLEIMFKSLKEKQDNLPSFYIKESQ